MKKGFTLLELLIVIIIVGILATISVPMIVKNLRRAYATEAIAALGTIRTQMRYSYSVTKDYTKTPDGKTLADSMPVVGNVPGIEVGDLDGTFWVDGDYYIKAVSEDAFMIAAEVWNPNRKAYNIAVSINQDGSVSEWYY